jgi:hypothetical protein
MITTKLVKGFFALVFIFGVQSQGADSCAETVTARSGDTCASIAELAGISVTDFLQSNPLVTSCSTLIEGVIYCKSGTASSSPVSISTDGACGGSVTCAGSQFGRCCSTHGYCGSSVDYCGEGCQLGLGECDDGSSPPEAPASDPAIVVATSTKIISATEIVQATVVITRTVRVTDTLTARASTRILTLTSVFPSTAIVTSTTVVRATSVRRSTRASTTLVTATVASTRRGRPQPTTTSKAQNTPPKPSPKPSPILPKTPDNCLQYDKIRDKDNCRSIANRNGLALSDLYDLPFPHISMPLKLDLLTLPLLEQLQAEPSNKQQDVITGLAILFTRFVVRSPGRDMSY